MASHVYYKFRAQISWDPISFDGHFVSVGELKRLICEKKSLGDAASELVLTDPNNGSEYSDDSAQIPKGARVILRRVPPNRARVLVGATPLPLAPPPPQRATPGAAAATGAPSTQAAGGETGDDFGADPFAQSAANLLQEQAAARSLALVAAAAPGPGGKGDRPGSWGLGGRGGPGRGGGGGRGGGRGPAVSYICRRCGEQGKHWEKDCSTVGDPTYDYKTVRMPTGIPVTKLQRNADGSLYLPTGELGELAPNQAAFRKELALMTGAAAAQQAAEAEAATEPASSPVLLLLPAPETAIKAEAESSETAQTATAAAGDSSIVAAAVKDSASEEIKSEQPAAQQEPDLFFDEDEAAAPIPISLGAEREQPPASPMHTNGNAEITDLGVAKLWESYHALKGDLPAGTTLKLWVEAFGAGRPLSAAEFRRLQKEHAAKSGRPGRQSQERERQHDTCTPSREPASPSPSPSPPDERQRMRSRSRSRSPPDPRQRLQSRSRSRSPPDLRHRLQSRSRSRERGRNSARVHSPPVSWRSRDRRTPSVPREADEQTIGKKARENGGERRPVTASAPNDEAARKGGERPRIVEERSRKQADDYVENAGRKRQRGSSEEPSERKIQDQDRYRPPAEPERQKSRSSPDAVAERHSNSDSGRDVADEGTSREGEQPRHGDSKKSKKKHRKEHKKKKDKHKKEHKSKRRSRSSSPPVGRGRSAGIEDNPDDRYVPSDYDAAGRDDEDRDGEVASSRRRRKASREERKREDRAEVPAADRGTKKPEKLLSAPGPGALFHRALTSVERSNGVRR